MSPVDGDALKAGATVATPKDVIGAANAIGGERK